jgi:outer membrane immunogenic protein
MQEWAGLGMKRVVLASAMLLATAIGAKAADLPVKAFYKAPPVLSPSWSGFYAGVNAGYSFGNDTFDQNFVGAAPLPGIGHVLPRGGVAGGQLGYNWQLGHVVLGVEGDGQWTGQHDTGCGGLECTLNFNGEVGAFSLSHDLNWFATVRGRAGFANDGYLLYITGGAAWAGVRETTFGAIDDARGQSAVSNVLNGWALGGGIEARLWGNWSAKAEYLHLDFNGTRTTSHVTGGPVAGVSFDYMNLANSHVTDDIARVGLNYRFWNTPAIAVVPIDPSAAAWRWTGFYLGLNGGYGTGSTEFRQFNFIDPAVGGPPGPGNSGNVSSWLPQKLGPKGGLAGGQAGFNWQIEHIVLGVEGDAQWTNQDDVGCGQACISGDSEAQHLNWFATARARVGWATDGYLLYVTGGGAWGEIEQTSTMVSSAVFTGHSTQTRGGWAGGGGIEARLTGNWTAKAEYLHLDLGSATSSFPVTDIFYNSFSVKSSFRDDIFRAGLNYKIDMN